AKTSTLDAKDSIGPVAWSPSGDRLAACTEQRCLVWTIATGRATKLRQTAGELAWSPDGRALALNHLTRIEVVDLAPHGKTTELASSANHAQMTWSPDGHYIVARPYPKFSADVMKALHTPDVPKVWELATGTAHSLEGHTGRLFDLAFSPTGALATGA